MTETDNLGIAHLSDTFLNFEGFRERTVGKPREQQIRSIRNRFGLPRHRAQLLAELFYGEVRT